MDPEEPIVIPINGELDLHLFLPREVKGVVLDYVEACLEEGIYQLRIVHGKGTGALRESVHSILRKMPEVESFKLAGGDGGGWGATLVELKEP